MNSFRQQIIRELAKNNIFMDSKGKKYPGEIRKGYYVNGYMLDAALLLYDPRRSLWGIYEKVVDDPLPFMIFFLKLLEWRMDEMGEI